jgi:hypothetical protein
MALTNAALLNISVVPGSAAVLASGDATNAARSYQLWFRSWAGARAVVEVLGSAYQDYGGNSGVRDTSLQVRATFTRYLCGHRPPAWGARALQTCIRWCCLRLPAGGRASL